MIREIIIDEDELSLICIECIKPFDHIITDLVDTAKFNKLRCLGLSANQIGYQLRIFIVKIKNKFIPMVNPECISNSKSFRFGVEECLSHPGKETKKKRYQIIKVSYFDPIKNIQIHNKVLKNMEARVFQHEMDHLNGILI